MFPRNYKKQNKILRFFLRIFNLYAFDKETLNIVNPNFDNRGKNIIELNKKSFNLATGYLNLTRKVHSIDIYYRYSPNNNLWNSTDSWKRIIPNIDKKTLISVCLLSLKKTLLKILENNNLSVKLHLISDKSDTSFENHIDKILKNEKFKFFKYETKIQGNRGSYLECCDLVNKAEDLIFFVEDDYLFELNCFNELINSFARISSILKKDIIMCTSDYPFYYDSLYKTNIYVGQNYRWRTVGETLLTFMFTKEIYKKYKNEIRDVGKKINKPFEKPLHDIYNDVECLAPIGSLSYHIGRSVPAINEDWLKLWNDNYLNFKNIIQQ